MDPFRSAAFGKIIEAAERGAHKGQRVFSCQVSVETSSNHSTEPLPELSTLIEDVESRGWRLEHIAPSERAATVLAVFRATDA